MYIHVYYIQTFTVYICERASATYIYRRTYLYTGILHADIHMYTTYRHTHYEWAGAMGKVRLLYACFYILYACFYIFYACFYILYVCLPLLHTWTGSMFYACLTYLKNNSSKTTCYCCF